MSSFKEELARLVRNAPNEDGYVEDMSGTITQITALLANTLPKELDRELSNDQKQTIAGAYLVGQGEAIRKIKRNLGIG